MKMLWWTILVVGLLIMAESGVSLYKNKENFSLRESLGRLFLMKGKFRAQELAIVGSIVVLFGLWGLRADVWVALTTKSSLSGVENQKLSISAFSLPNETIKIYENEVFGSTILPILTEKTFYPGETPNSSVGIPAENEFGGEKVLYVPPTGGLITAWDAPSEQYNQFAGEYEVEIWAKRGSKTIPRETVLLEVSVGQEVQKFPAYQFKSDRFFPLDLGYRVKTTARMPQISLKTSGEESLWIEKVVLRPKGVLSDPSAVPDTYPDVPDMAASGTSARKADPKKHLPGVMAFGPYDAALPSGKLKAEFRLKTPKHNYEENPIVGKIQTASLTPNTKKQIIEEKIIKLQDFKNAGEYESFFLPVESKKGNKTEFRVYFNDVVELFFDGVKIIKE